MDWLNNQYHSPNLRDQTTSAGINSVHSKSSATRRRTQNSPAIQRSRLPQSSTENFRWPSDGSNQILPSQPPDSGGFADPTALLRFSSQEQATYRNQSLYPSPNNVAENIVDERTNQFNPQTFFGSNNPIQYASTPQNFLTGQYHDPNQNFQNQDIPFEFNSSQTDPRQRIEEYVLSEPQLNASNSTSSVLNVDAPDSAYSPSLSANKRLRLEEERFSFRDIGSAGGASNRSSNEDPTRLYDYDVVLLCCAWRIANPQTQPEASDYALISEVCNASEDTTKDMFDSIQNQAIRPDQNSPDHVSSSVLNIWHRKNPGKHPSNSLLISIGKVFHGHYDSLRRFSTRNATSPSTTRDSAMGKSLRTTTSSINQTFSYTEESQISCISNAKKGSVKVKPRHEWKFDPERRFLCTDCGKNFSEKGAWKRHVSETRQAETWHCTLCYKTRTWSRKDQLIEHIEKDHASNLGETIELQGTLSYGSFKKQCVFLDCHVPLTSFRDSKEHIAKCFEKHKPWGFRDLRCDGDESIPRVIIDHPGNSPSEKRDDDDDDDGGGDDDRPEDSARESPGDASGGGSNNNRSSLAPGSPSASSSRSSSSQGSRGSGSAYRNNGHSFGKHAAKPSVASDDEPVVTKSPSRSILKGTSLSHFKQIWLSSKFHVLGRLGSGGRAVVDEVWVNGFTRTLALKTFKSSLQNPLQEWRREIEIMKKLKEHPHVVKLVCIHNQHGSSALLLQPVADYDLDKYLGSYSATSDEQRNIWLWFSCLASGLESLHENGVIHHDIKPQNILVKNKKVLFADFGSSCTVDEKTRLLLEGGTAFHHTKLYAAPEVEHGNFTTASDVFSLGCVFLEMVTILISLDLWKQLRALQNSFYHRQESSSRHWASEWTEQIRLHTSKERVSGNQYDPILEVCHQMTQFEIEKRPNAANLYTQINLPLRRQCDFPIARHPYPHHHHQHQQPEIPQSRKRSSQETETQSKRLANPPKVKATNEVTVNTTTQPNIPIVSISYDASPSDALSSQTHPMPPTENQPQELEKPNNVDKRVHDITNVASQLSTLAVSTTARTSTRNRAKSCGCYVPATLDGSPKMLDRFVNDRHPLEDCMVSGYSRFDEGRRTAATKHNSTNATTTAIVHQRINAFVGGLSPVSATFISKGKLEVKSMPASTEEIIATKIGNNNSVRRSRRRSVFHSYYPCPTSETGSQFGGVFPIR